MNCEICGEELKTGKVTIAGCEQEYTIMCECKVRAHEEDERRALEEGTTRTKESRLTSIGLRKRNRVRFSDIKPTPGQENAYKEILNYANKWDENNETGLLVVGPVGSGKTLMVCAMARYISDRIPIDKRSAKSAGRYGLDRFLPYVPIRFITSIELFENIRKSMDFNNRDEIDIEIYKEIPLLIIDDIGAERMTDTMRSRLLEIIDYRYSEMLPMIITTNLTLDQLETELGARATDRLKSMCKLVTIKAKSQRKPA